MINYYFIGTYKPFNVDQPSYKGPDICWYILERSDTLKFAEIGHVENDVMGITFSIISCFAKTI